jgi:hypothetical protein
MQISLRHTVIIAITILLPQSAVAQGNKHGPEQTLFQSANRERTAQGLPPLKWDDALAAAAQQHALRLARQNTLSHQFPGEPDLSGRVAQAGAHFSSIAENIAEGPTAENIHEQWMKSPPHRRNLLDPQLDSIGISVAERNRTWFAVEDFSLAGGALSLQDQERVVAAQLQSRGLRLLKYTDDARRTCAMDNGYAGTHPPSFVLHYATTDLQGLPDMLERRIQSGQYHAATVGACPSSKKTGLSMYRIAVILYE